jgi:hypothetical protein
MHIKGRHGKVHAGIAASQLSAISIALELTGLIHKEADPQMFWQNAKLLANAAVCRFDE